MPVQRRASAVIGTYNPAMSNLAASSLRDLQSHLPENMDIPALLTVVEALALLTTLSGRPWTRTSFFSLVVDLALPMRSITPSGACPVIAAGEEFVSAQLPYPGRRLAVLSTPQIKDLWLYGETHTRSVALEPGEPGHLAWDEIKGRRKVLNRSLQSPELWNEKWSDGAWHDGEFMGECAFSLFNDVVQVTDDTCRVPRETIMELLAVFTRDLDSRTKASGSTQEGALGADVTPIGVSEPDLSNATDLLARLFDPVTPAVLERMFPAGDNWREWAERAARNGLKEARQGRGLFNPYRAALWFLGQNQPSWDLARCHRILARNLPPRSQSEDYKLTGLLD